MIAVGFTAAKKQTVVRGKAEIIHDEFARVDAAVVGDERAGALPTKRCGCKHMVDNWHDFAADPRHQIIEISVTAQQHVRRTYLTAFGMHDARVRPANVQDFAGLEDLRAARPRRARNAKKKIERVHMAAAGVEATAAVNLARHHFADLFFRNHAVPGVTVVLRKIFGFLGESRQESIPGGGEKVAGPVVAINLVSINVLRDDRLGLLRHFPEQPCVFPAGDALQCSYSAAKPRAHLAAVTPRGTETESIGLQKHHPITALRQRQRRGQAGKPSPNDANVGEALAF